MRKIRKGFYLISIITLLCRNVAFCFSQEDFTLRPPSHFSKSTESFIDIQTESGKDRNSPKEWRSGDILRGRDDNRKYVVYINRIMPKTGEWTVSITPIFNSLTGHDVMDYTLEEAENKFTFERGKDVIEKQIEIDVVKLKDLDPLLNQLRQVLDRIDNAFAAYSVEKELYDLESEVLSILYKLKKITTESQVPSKSYDAYIDTLVSVILAFPATVFPYTEYMEPSIYHDPMTMAHILLQDVPEILVWKKLSSKIMPLDSNAARRLGLGMSIVSKSFGELNELYLVQKEAGSIELGYDIIYPEGADYPIVIQYKDLEARTATRFDEFVLNRGHSHHFHIPLNYSDGDFKNAKRRSKEGKTGAFFILGFGEDRHVELALWDPERSSFVLEHENQQWISERLREAGLLSPADVFLKELYKELKELEKSTYFQLRDPYIYPSIIEIVSQIKDIVLENEIGDEELIDMAELFVQMMARTTADEGIFQERVSILLSMAEAVNVVAGNIQDAKKYQERFTFFKGIVESVEELAGRFLEDATLAERCNDVVLTLEKKTEGEKIKFGLKIPNRIIQEDL